MKILFLNFSDCPENVHFECAFAAACRKSGINLETICDIENNSFYYSVLEGAKDVSLRKKYGGMKDFKSVPFGEYDCAFILDFPKRKKCLAPLLWFMKNAPIPKIFALNHLLFAQGDNYSCDMARRTKIFSRADIFCRLEYDGKFSWQECGIPKKLILKRKYAIDTSFYGYAGYEGDYLFSAGSAGRDFETLEKCAQDFKTKLIILSDLRPPATTGTAEYLVFSANTQKVRELIAGSSLVILPIKKEHKNEAAGNSVIFMAMSMGKLVLTKRTGYMEKYIKDGENGFFYR